MTGDPPVDIRRALRWAADRLREAGSLSPELDAEVLLRFLLNIDRLEVYRRPERSISPEEFRAFELLIGRRSAGEPVAYIVERKEFWSLEFEVNPAVLIPRPETEILVEEVLATIAGRNNPLRILDIGTGSGAIACALACELSAAVVAVDNSAAALEVAKRNAVRNGLGGRIHFLKSDLFAGLDGLFDVICSNPPYISAAEYPGLPRGVKDYEPRDALLAGPKGTEVHELIIGKAIDYLAEGGWIFLEIGAFQEEELRKIFVATGRYEGIEFRSDYGGLTRVVKAKRS
ncbi:MAG: peptide chain release factor N(5)-glutamine methyltransferase [Smithellaceae bacterium]|nr:peptide chain release factor N(5)-glutamine methyltransferase [Smithellaceae bacterium]